MPKFYIFFCHCVAILEKRLGLPYHVAGISRFLPRNYSPLPPFRKRACTHAHNNVGGGLRTIHFRIVGWSILGNQLHECLQQFLARMDGVQLVVGCVALTLLSFCTACCQTLSKFAWHFMIKSFTFSTAIPLVQ